MLLPVFLRDKNGLRRIHPEDIVGLEVVKNYTKVFVEGDRYFMIRASLSSAHKKLPQDIFIRIHRSYVVSIFHIDEVNRDHLLVKGEPIPIAKNYYGRVKAKLNILE